jgi:hypothetical protein
MKTINTNKSIYFIGPEPNRNSYKKDGKKFFRLLGCMQSFFLVEKSSCDRPHFYRDDSGVFVFCGWVRAKIVFIVIIITTIIIINHYYYYYFLKLLLLFYYCYYFFNYYCYYHYCCFIAYLPASLHFLNYFIDFIKKKRTTFEWNKIYLHLKET